MDWNWSRLLGLTSEHQRDRRLMQRTARRSRIGLSSQSESLEPRLVLTISSEEQLFVYLLNKARHDPQQYEIDQKLPVSLAGVAARPPLAANTDLFDSAKFHATEMAVNNYFGHQSDVTGDWPNKLARDQGYVLPSYFDSDNNYIESIAAGTLDDTAQEVIDQLVIDKGVPSLGHRLHLLSIGDFYEDSREIGIGHAFSKASTYSHYWAVHATFSNTADTFLTGVVFQDANKNQAFGLNEGLAGVTVSIAGNNLQTQTNAAGGWSIKVPGAGTYTVSASGGAFIGTATASVNVAKQNREVDFISGKADAVIDFTASSPSGGNTTPVNPTAAAPVLTLPSSAVTSIKGAKVIVGAAATLNDADSSDFSGGSLTIRIAIGGQSGDVLTLNSIGTKAGQVNLSGSQVRLGKTVVGKLAGGANGTPLTIQFTASVTTTTVQSILQNVTLKSSAKRLKAGTRTIEFVLVDPTQQSSMPATRQVNVPA